jgi:hypothetical protein
METQTQIIGPECFASGDGEVICWRGQNYIRQSPPSAVINQERLTETFRGRKAKQDAHAWRDRMAAQGWREESFSGVSGVGSYKACSLTLIRP